MNTKVWGRGVITLLAILLTAAALRADEAEETRPPIETVLKMDSNVNRDEQADGKPVIGVHLFDPKKPYEDLKVLKEFKHLQYVSIGGPNVTAEGLRVLRDCKHLQEIDLRGTSIRRTRGWNTWPGLRNSIIPYAQRRDHGRGVKALGRPDGVATAPYLGAPKATDAGMKYLGGLTKLQEPERRSRQ